MTKLGKRLVLIGILMVLAFAMMPAFAQEEGGAVPPVFDLTWINATIGFFLPLLISALKSANASTSTKKAIALGVSIVAGVVSVGVQAGWEFANAGEFAQLAAASITQVYVAAQAFYLGFWEDTPVEASLEQLGSS